MRRIVPGAVAGVVLSVALAACSSGGGSSGPQSLAGFCKTYKPVNEKVEADFGKLESGGTPPEAKAAVNDAIAQVQKALDAQPPQSIKADIQTAHDAFVNLKGELAKIDYDITKLKGPPQAISDPKFQTASAALNAYGAQNCGIKSSNDNNQAPSGSAP